VLASRIAKQLLIFSEQFNPLPSLFFSVSLNGALIPVTVPIPSFEFHNFTCSDSVPKCVARVRGGDALPQLFCVRRDVMGWVGGHRKHRNPFHGGCLFRGCLRPRRPLSSINERVTRLILPRRLSVGVSLSPCLSRVRAFFS